MTGKAKLPSIIKWSGKGILLSTLITATISAQIDSSLAARVFSQELEQTAGRYDQLEISELLIDQTQSKIAREFYDLFYSLWSSPVENLDYSLLFEEKPLPSFGTQITITINEVIIFQQFIRPRYETIEMMANQAVYQAANYLINYNEIQKQLEYEELAGSGIY